MICCVQSKVNKVKLAYHGLARMWIGGLLALASAIQAQGQIRTYSVPKEHPASAGAPIHWTVPGDWKTLAPSGIRIGNFIVEKAGKKADIAVQSFPGAVGAEVDNVNRWRQQVALEAISQSEIVWKPITVDGSDGKLYDLSGPSDRILVASIPRDGNTWFFKMRGDKDLVQAQQPAFLDFLKSATFNRNGTQLQSAMHTADAAPPIPPAGSFETPDPRAGLGTADPHAGLGLSANEGSSEMPKWNAPSNWEEKTPGPMILKSFSVVGDHGAAATVTINVLGGEGGGVLANVNRWRGQLGLPPVTSEDLPKMIQSLDTAAGKAMLVDLSGSDKAGQPARLIVAKVSHGGGTWFYKIMGVAPTVAQEKGKFVQFVQTVQYP
jgi:hypothetical protein